MSLQGWDGVAEALKKIALAIPKQVQAAVYQEALVVNKASVRRTPVDKGPLRASHEVSRPELVSDGWTVRISVGGPSAPYSVIVHEDLTAHHEVGQAKFLESAVAEASPEFAERVAKRIELNRSNA